MKSQILIIGGGASGLAAAISAASSGSPVKIIEQKDNVGRKILVTGNGRCNLTNLNQDLKNYRGNDPNFAKRVLDSFGLKQTFDFFDSLGLFLKDRDGYVYPYSDQAASVADALRSKCIQLGVEIQCHTKAEEIRYTDGRFLVTLRESNGSTYTIKSQKVILSTGGMAAPQNGSDGSGIALARRLGHRIINPGPALTGLYCKEKFFKNLSGVRTSARISLYINDRIYAMEEGELQLTNYGISGIPVFQISRYVSRALDDKMSAEVEIDFMPNHKSEDLNDFIRHQLQINPQLTLSGMLCGILNKKLVHMIIKRLQFNPDSLLAELTTKRIQALLDQIKCFRTVIAHPNTYEFAQVSAGGVDTREISSDTLESKLFPGLYITGELIDIDGACGGYNLQWAWSSGCIAGKAAAKERISNVKD